MSAEPAVVTERPARAVSFRWPASFVIFDAIWGCSFWWIKLGLRAVSPVDLAFARLTAGAVALLLISALIRTQLPCRAATWGHLIVLVGIINALTPRATRSPSFVSNDPTRRPSAASQAASSVSSYSWALARHASTVALAGNCGLTLRQPGRIRG